MECFENARFLMWIGENRTSFENDQEKSVIYCHSHQRFRRYFSEDDRRKRLKKYGFSNEKESVWTGGNN